MVRENKERRMKLLRENEERMEEALQKSESGETSEKHRAENDERASAPDCPVGFLLIIRLVMELVSKSKSKI